MDIQATLGDAKSYIEKLQNEVKALENELKDMEEEANKISELKDRTVADKGKTEDYVTSHLSASDISTDQSKYNQDSLPAHDLAQQMEETVEVSKCGKNTFALKLIFQRRRGWFLMLMAAIQALGLNLTEANVISVKGMVMNIFKAEVKSDGVQAEQLKDSLLKLLHNGLLMDKA
ncbi:Aborted microspores transcription factor protein [Thalictrum thalictroides]|nr:Aborted microspores transcription factor protein [Thalictrum thalictroides]